MCSGTPGPTSWPPSPTCTKAVASPPCSTTWQACTRASAPPIQPGHPWNAWLHRVRGSSSRAGTGCRPARPTRPCMATSVAWPLSWANISSGGPTGRTPPSSTAPCRPTTASGSRWCKPSARPAPPLCARSAPCSTPEHRGHWGMRILLAEDETELGTWLVKALAQNDFQVDWVNDGRLVRRSLKATKDDALILDLGLPGLGGHDVLSDLREADERLPVLILTARDSLMERVTCLHGGADDFLAKPFDVDELEARLIALIRRSRGQDHPRFACGPLNYDSAGKQFRLQHEVLSLTPREHAVLRALIQHPGEPLSKRELLERVFSDEQDVNPEVIEVLIHRLRKRLEASPVRIAPLRGLGYQLESAA